FVDILFYLFFFFSSRRRHTRFSRDWSSDVCSSDLIRTGGPLQFGHYGLPVTAGCYAQSEQRGGKTGQLGHHVHSLSALKVDEARSEERRVGKECRSRWWTYRRR